MMLQSILKPRSAPPALSAPRATTRASKSELSALYRSLSAELPHLSAMAPEAARMVSSARLDLFAAWSKLRMAESVLQRSKAAPEPILDSTN